VLIATPPRHPPQHRAGVQRPHGGCLCSPAPTFPCTPVPAPAPAPLCASGEVLAVARHQGPPRAQQATPPTTPPPPASGRGGTPPWVDATVALTSLYPVPLPLPPAPAPRPCPCPCPTLLACASVCRSGAGSTMTPRAMRSHRRRRPRHSPQHRAGVQCLHGGCLCAGAAPSGGGRERGPEGALDEVEHAEKRQFWEQDPSPETIRQRLPQILERFSALQVCGREVLGTRFFVLFSKRN